MEAKETKEALKGLIKLAALLAVEFKDGVQAADVAPILAKMQDPAIQEALKAAYNDIDKVPSELKEASVAEYLDLVASIIPEVVDLIKAIKK